MNLHEFKTKQFVLKKDVILLQVFMLKNSLNLII